MAFALVATPGCREPAPLRIPLTAVPGGLRAEELILVPDGARLELLGRLAPPARTGQPVGADVEVWAHGSDGTTWSLHAGELEPGVRELTSSVDLGAIANEPVLLSVRVKGPREVDWDRLEVVAELLGGLPSRAGGQYGPWSPPPARGPDVVVYLIDTLRRDAFSAFGSRVPTPAFDRLAASGMRFDEAITPATWTRPATASLFTGAYPSTHGARDRHHVLTERAYTLAERMRLLGYRTAAVVGNGNISASQGFDQGFESFSFVPAAVPTTGPVMDHARAPRLHELALQSWRDGLDPRPLLLYVHTVDPHGPYKPPERLLEKERPAIYGGHTDRTLFAMEQGERAATPELIEDLMDLYLGEVAYADREFGRFFLELTASSRGRELLLVLTSDHGEAFMEHGFAIHGRSLHREELDIPLVLWGAGVPPGRRVQEPVSLVDVLPTLVAAAAGQASGVQGRDLLAPEEAAVEPRRLFAELELGDRTWTGLRDGRWALLRDAGKARLYDRASAFRERLLAARLGEPEVLRGLPDEDVIQNLRALG